jgi:Protein of unknown function (DUF3500)
MNRRTLLLLLSNCAGLLLARSGQASNASPGLAQTRAASDSADDFLRSLSREQRANAQFPFVLQKVATAAHFTGGKFGTTLFTGEEYGRAMWSNFPVSDVPRPGLRMGSLSETQRASVMAMLQALLSGRGYEKVQEIMGSDQALVETGVPYAAGRDAYTLAIFGKPSVSAPWMVQFGGHHLALNITIKGDRAVLAPMLTGALPAVYSKNDRTVRVLAGENDRAFALLHSLNEEQLLAATFEHDVSDLVLGPGHDGEAIATVGLKGSAMTDQQRAMLFDLIHEWPGILHDAYTESCFANIKRNLQGIYFAWSGPTTHAKDRNGSSYFRITGPQLMIEFSPQRPGGDLTMHVHTIYRDPSNAYGHALFAS